MKAYESKKKMLREKSRANEGGVFLWLSASLAASSKSRLSSQSIAP